MVAICIHIGVENRWYDCTGYVLVELSTWTTSPQQWNVHFIIRISSKVPPSRSMWTSSHTTQWYWGLSVWDHVSTCGRMGENYQTCQGCHFVRYCGKQCQRRHWKAGHRSSCSTIMFDHRRRRRAEHLAVWGTLSGYDFDLWVHLAGDRAREMVKCRKSHIYAT